MMGYSSYPESFISLSSSPHSSVHLGPPLLSILPLLLQIAWLADSSRVYPGSSGTTTHRRAGR